MKQSSYYELEQLLLKINDLKDQIDFIKFNNMEGPKFSSIKEMKEFIVNVENDKFNFWIDDTSQNKCETNLIEQFNYSKNEYNFFIYTIKRNDKYITYLSIKKLKDNMILENLCGKENTNRENAHNHFENLKQIIINYEINDIMKSLKIGARKTIKMLKQKLNSMTSVKN